MYFSQSDGRNNIELVVVYMCVAPPRPSMGTMLTLLYNHYNK